LSGVQLLLSPSGIVAFSDGAGRYVLTGVPPGQYVLAARKIGYLSRELTGVVVHAPAGEAYRGTSVNVELFTPQAFEAGEVGPARKSPCGATPWRWLASSDVFLHQNPLDPAVALPKDSTVRRFRNQRVCAFAVQESVRYLTDSTNLRALMDDHPELYSWESSVWDVLTSGQLLITRVAWGDRDQRGWTPVHFVLFDLRSLRLVGYLWAPVLR
jgi:hypothetical protein